MGTSPHLAGPSAPPSSRPDLAAIGHAGGYYLLKPPDWVVRHVETVEIESTVSAIRRLTVDLALPTDAAPILQIREEHALFCVPFALLGKQPLTGQFDVRDEAGLALPLLTRAENAEISEHALRRAMTVNGSASYREFPLELKELVRGEPEEPKTALAALLMQHQVNPRNDGAARLRQVIGALAGSSMLWVHLWGEPGQRRVVKLAYATSRTRPPRLVRALRTQPRQIDYRDERGVVSFPVPVPGPIEWIPTISRLTSSLRVGLGAPEVNRVDFPDMHGAHTYHFQLSAPEGVTLVAIKHEEDRDGRSPTEAITHCDGDRAHLYLADLGAVAKPSIRVALRVERKGFLVLSVLATVITAAGLWLARAHAETATHRDVNQISAAVLLVLPALLAIFASRPTEHPTVTRMLSAVRGLVLLAGLTSVTAAAALSAFRHSDWRDVQRVWTWCAIAASIAAIGVLGAWLRTFEAWRSWEGQRPRQYLARVAFAGLLVVGLCAAVRYGWFDLGEELRPALAALALAALIAVVVAVDETCFPAGALRAACAVFALAALALLAAVAVGDVELRNAVAVGAGAAATGALLVSTSSRLPQRRPQNLSTNRS